MATSTMRETGFDPWVGKIPWRRKWQSTPVLLPGKSHGQRSLVGYSPWGCKESDTAERLHSLMATLAEPPKWEGLYVRGRQGWNQKEIYSFLVERYLALLQFLFCYLSPTANCRGEHRDGSLYLGEEKMGFA